MVERYKRRPKGKEYVPLTMRYTPEIYKEVRRYAFEHNMSIGMANEEIIALGLEATKKAKKRA